MTRDDMTGYSWLATSLLNILHHQQRPVIPPRRLDRACDYPGKSLAQFRKLPHQSFDHCHIVLKTLVSIGGVRRLVLDHEVKVISYGQGEDGGELVGLGSGREI